MWTSFIGFMASGKSTVCRRLQTSTRRPAVSLDDEIVRRNDRSVADIFGELGEPAFRRLELEALVDLDPLRPLVVSTGGGVVQTQEAVQILRRHGVVIWLDAAWEIVRARLQESPSGQRPLVDELGWPGLEELYRHRQPLYAAVADFRLSVDDTSPDDLAQTAMLRSLLWERRRNEETS